MFNPSSGTLYHKCSLYSPSILLSNPSQTKTQLNNKTFRQQRPPKDHSVVFPTTRTTCGLTHHRCYFLPQIPLPAPTPNYELQELLTMLCKFATLIVGCITHMSTFPKRSVTTPTQHSALIRRRQMTAIVGDTGATFQVIGLCITDALVCSSGRVLVRQIAPHPTSYSADIIIIVQLLHRL